MVRQARNYLVGAASGAGLIAGAIVAFVLLVSALVFEDLPVVGLGGGEEAAVSPAKPAAAGVTAAVTGPGLGQGGPAAGAGAANGGGATGNQPRQGGGSGGQSVGGGSQGSSGGGDEGASGGGGGDGSPTTTGSPGSGGGATGTASSDGGAAGGGSGGNAGSGGGGSGSTTSSTSAKVTGTVNETVNQVDQTVTGGALGQTGVTEVTEGVVDGVAGPESVVGKVVDETVGAVEGLLGGGK